MKSKSLMDDEIMKIAEILCSEKQQLLKNICLSANTVANQVNDLAGYKVSS
jgi:hypothetical protein